jgi:hypothetical protein
MLLDQPILTRDCAHRLQERIRQELKSCCIDVSPVPIGPEPVTQLEYVALVRGGGPQIFHLEQRAAKRCQVIEIIDWQLIHVQTPAGLPIKIHIAHTRGGSHEVYAAHGLPYPLKD